MEPPWPRGSVLGLRPPGLEFRILCLEDSVIEVLSARPSRCVDPDSYECWSKQTQDVEPMLIYCLPIVSDSGPTLNQPWFSVSCLLGCKLSLCVQLTATEEGCAMVRQRTGVRLQTAIKIKGQYRCVQSDRLLVLIKPQVFLFELREPDLCQQPQTGFWLGHWLASVGPVITDQRRFPFPALLTSPERTKVLGELVYPA